MDVFNHRKLSLLVFIILLFYNLIVNGCFANSLKNLKITSRTHEHEASKQADKHRFIDRAESSRLVGKSVDFIVNAFEMCVYLVSTAYIWADGCIYLISWCVQLRFDEHE